MKLYFMCVAYKAMLQTKIFLKMFISNIHNTNIKLFEVKHIESVKYYWDYGYNNWIKPKEAFNLYIFYMVTHCCDIYYVNRTQFLIHVIKILIS